MEFTPAMSLLVGVSAGEAVMIKGRDLECEHIFLGLLKIEDLLKSEKPPGDMDQDSWQTARVEIQKLGQFLQGKGISSPALRRRMRRLVKNQGLPQGEFSGHRSPACRELFTTMEQNASKRGSELVTLMDAWQACIEMESPSLDQLLQENELERAKLYTENLPEWLEDLEDQPVVERGKKSEDADEGEQESPLAGFGRDLSQMARQGKLHEVVGRREEMKQVTRILLQAKQNNPMLLGDPGVGKTALVEGLAYLGAQPDAPADLRGLHFIEITTAALVAGTMYRGQLEERLQKLLKLAGEDPNLVLFIDEIHTLMGAGAGSNSNLDIANILKPALARGELRCIGATTIDEYRKHIEVDPALARRFQILWINEPTPAETTQILQVLRLRLEKHHFLSIPEDLLGRAVELSVRYLSDGFLPDKAIKVLDEACARRRLLTFSVGEGKDDEKVLTIEDIASVIARRTQMEPEVILMRDEEKLLRMEQALGERVMGQDLALRILAQAVRTGRAGLKAPGKPVVLLFAGPSGTGKTELAKALAEFLFNSEDALIRVDLTEFQEAHTVAKLIGSPPGYVGFGDEPHLVREVRRRPHSVVLLDEIEKAHPEILTLFMQVFDEGRLTDARGRLVNFKDTIIILTSNLGSVRPKARPAIGFAKGGSIATEKVQAQEQREFEASIRQAVTGHMRPELLNRIQELVIFQPLSPEAVEAILNKFLSGLNQRLAARDLKIELDTVAQQFIAQRGVSPEYGARHLGREFERLLVHPLTNHILAGDFPPGTTIVGSACDDQITFEIRRKRGRETVAIRSPRD